MCSFVICLRVVVWPFWEILLTTGIAFFIVEMGKWKLRKTKQISQGQVTLSVNNRVWVQTQVCLLLK